MNGWSMDKPGKTIGNIVSDTLTFTDDMGLSMAASDNPRLGTTKKVLRLFLACEKVHKSRFSTVLLFPFLVNIMW